MKQSVVLRGLACIDGYGKPQVLARFNKNETGVFVRIYIDKFDGDVQKITKDITEYFEHPIRDAITAKRYVAVKGDMLINMEDRKVPRFLVFARSIEPIVKVNDTFESREPLPSDVGVEPFDVGVDPMTDTSF